MNATRPANEAARTVALSECAALEQLERSVASLFQGIVEDAAKVCAAPIAVLNLIGEDDVRCLASVGWHPGSVRRDDAFCSVAILGSEPFVVPDAASDARFADNPLVTGEPGIRMYAGVPLLTGDGFALGTLCVIDREARILSAEQLHGLRSLASHATALLEVRRAQTHVRRAIEERERAEARRDESEQQFQFLADHSVDIIARCRTDGVCTYVSPAVETLLGYRPDEFVGLALAELVHEDDRPAVRQAIEIAVNSGQSQIAEYRALSKAGAWIWIESTLTPVFDDETKEVRELQLHGRDITTRHLVDEALRQSEERFRLLAENASDLISRHAPDGAFLYASPASMTMLGYAPEELIGMPSLRLVHRDDRQSIIDEITTRQRGAAVTPAVCRMRRKDGTYIWVESTDRALYDEVTGELTEYQSVSRNITKRVQAEEALRESEERFRKIFEESPIAMGIIGPDTRFEKVNAAFQELLGYTEEELRDLYIGDVSDPGEMEANTTNIRQMFAGEIDSYRMEKRYKKKSGETIWAELTGAAMHDRDGVTRSGLGIVEDITERKRVREELQASEERFRRIFEESRVAISVIGLNREFERANPAFCDLLGYSESELMRLSPSDVTVADDVAENLELTNRLFAGEIDSYRAEKRYLTKSGEMIWAHLTVAAMHDSDGVTRSSIGMVEDITDRKRAESALRNLAAVKSDFVALVSHELRAPLTNMNGAIELMSGRAEQLPDDDARRTLQILAEQTARLTYLVSSILDVSRLDAGQMPMTSGPVAVDIVASQAIAALSARLTTPEVRLVAARELPLAWADETYVRQVIENLIRNAIKHGRTDEPIVVAVGASDGAVTLSVTDRGRGIPADEQPYIFDAFFRSSKNDAQNDGHGLGLYFARKLVEAQGGAIALTSPAFGDAASPGTRFTISLPVAPEEP